MEIKYKRNIVFHSCQISICFLSFYAQNCEGPFIEWCRSYTHILPLCRSNLTGYMSAEMWMRWAFPFCHVFSISHNVDTEVVLSGQVEKPEEWDVKDTAGWSSRRGVTSQESCGNRNSSADACPKIISWTLQSRDSSRFQPSRLHWSSGHIYISLHLISPSSLRANSSPNPLRAGSFLQMKKVPSCCSLKKLCAAKLVIEKVFCWPKRTIAAKPYC